MLILFLSGLCHVVWTAALVMDASRWTKRAWNPPYQGQRPIVAPCNEGRRVDGLPKLSEPTLKIPPCRRWRHWFPQALISQLCNGSA